MKIEMHCHTSEVSPCARVPAAKVISEHKRAGYDAVVITDHFNDYVLRLFSGSPEERVDCYLKGYQAAKAAGDKLGIKVFFGIETCLAGAGYEDYLIYGSSPDFLYEYPTLYDMYQKEAYEICRQKGYLFLQAHPYRSYCRPQNPDYMDGIEVHNGNTSQIINNQKAERWAKENPRFVRTSGSDYHELADLDRGGIVTDQEINTNRELVECLKAGVRLLR